MTEKLQNPFEIGELITAVNSTIDDVNEKQDILVSGTNIKTINNESILGSGNITIEGGGDAVWGAITGTLSNQTDLQTVLNAKAADNAVVKLTGNQSIAGIKTFSGNNRITALQNSTVTYNTAPSSDTFTDISFRDKNGYEMGVLEHVRFTNNDTAIRLVAKGADGDWSTSLMVGRKADGTVYTSAPTPSSGDNSTKIATTAFVKNQGYAVDSGLVHTTGNETISGIKTFTSEVNFSAGNSLTKVIQQGDENFCIYKNDIPILSTGTDVNAPILLAPANQTTQQYSIVTTLEINDSCIRFSNSLMIQMGYHNASSGWITFSYPFVNNAYQIATAEDGGHEYSPSVSNLKTTGFTWGTGRGGRWIAIGRWY